MDDIKLVLLGNLRFNSKETDSALLAAADKVIRNINAMTDDELLKALEDADDVLAGAEVTQVALNNIGRG